MNANRVVGDFHIHTTASDGQLPLPEVIRLARGADLEAIAITDHDRLHPALPEPVTYREELTVVRGIELKVVRESGDHIDLLGYGVRQTERLRRLIQRLQDDREQRADRMLARLEEQLDIQLDPDVAPGIGRPHVARAVADHPDTRLTVQEVFDQLIGNGRPCHVPRKVPSCAEGIDILGTAADLVAVAHPLRYSDVEGALSVASSVGAVERWYPYESSVDLGRIDEYIDRNGLIATGGSDAHGEEVGITGLDVDACAAVLSVVG